MLSPDQREQLLRLAWAAVVLFAVIVVALVATEVSCKVLDCV